MTQPEGADVRLVETAEELRAILGEPVKRVTSKTRRQLTAADRSWLAASSLCLVGTSDAEGRCDVSPKGDPAGFVHVLDDRTLALPERPGNRRGDGFHNLLSNPQVGLLFVVAGRQDTLRINGRARIVRDAPWFAELVVKGHRPSLALSVDIEEVFLHCPKAFMRSKLWEPSTWRPDALPSHAELIKQVQDVEETLEELQDYYGPSYARKLYEAGGGGTR